MCWNVINTFNCGHVEVNQIDPECQCPKHWIKALPAPKTQPKGSTLLAPVTRCMICTHRSNLDDSQMVRMKKKMNRTPGHLEPSLSDEEKVHPYERYPESHKELLSAMDRILETDQLIWEWVSEVKMSGKEGVLEPSLEIQNRVMAEALFDKLPWSRGSKYDSRV